MTDFDPTGFCTEHNRMACPLHDVSPDPEPQARLTVLPSPEEMARRTRLAIEALPTLQAELTQLHQEIVGSHPNHPVGSCDRCATDPGINGMADPDWEEPKLEHTVRGKTAGPEGWPYGTTHDMDCPACQGTPFTASPRSETYWSS